MQHALGGDVNMIFFLFLCPFARGEQTEESDVDILFEPDMSQRFSLFTLGGMYMDLRDLLGREIDLVPVGSLVSYAQQSANQDKVLIYEREN